MTAHRRHGVSMPKEKAQALLEQVRTIPRIQARIEPSPKGKKVRLHLQYVGRSLYVNSERDLESILDVWGLFK